MQDTQEKMQLETKCWETKSQLHVHACNLLKWKVPMKLYLQLHESPCSFSVAEPLKITVSCKHKTSFLQKSLLTLLQGKLLVY